MQNVRDLTVVFEQAMLVASNMEKDMRDFYNGCVDPIKINRKEDNLEKRTIHVHRRSQQSKRPSSYSALLEEGGGSYPSPFHGRAPFLAREALRTAFFSYPLPHRNRLLRYT